jgi:hypothetical protein
VNQPRSAPVLALAGLLLAASPLAAEAEPELASEASSPGLTAFHARLAKEQLLQDIGWKLVTGNARYCADAAPAIGLQLHDMASYSEPLAVRKLLGLKGDIAVLTAADGSPAQQAGMATNQSIAAIADEDPNSWSAQPNRDWQRIKRAHDRIDAQLAETGTVAITLSDGGSISAIGVAACASRFELGGDTKRAVAEGSRVIIGLDFPGFDYVEEEFAAAIAHELAHNLLRHREWLESEGRKRRNIRLTEREADRLMPWLLANAGYDPAASVRFMEQWGPRHGGGIFRKRTHDGWDERVQFIEAELPQINALLQREGAADWQRHFRREINARD